MSDNSQVNPHTFLLGSGCISALIVTFVGILGLLVVRSMDALIVAGVLFWIIVAFRVGWHWDDEGWTRQVRGAMANGLVFTLAALATATALVGISGADWSHRDWLIRLAIVPTVASAELMGFFIGLWTHRHRLRARRIAD